MHRNLQLISAFRRAFFDEQTSLLPVAAHGLKTIRSYSGNTVRLDIKPFREVLTERRNEAQRSVLVQVQSDNSCNDLYDYCSGFGNVLNMFHYQTPKNVHYVLVEMDSSPSVEELTRRVNHLDTSQAIPVLSPFLWFKMSSKTKLEKKSKKNLSILQQGILLNSENKTSIMSALKKSISVSNQISELRKMTDITELGTRLRFLTARQIEMGLRGIFRDLHAYPFGSSVNGFGRNGCDLDLVLVFPDSQIEDSRLVFHAKACSAEDRHQIQNHIEVIGDLLHCFMPGCIGVKRITQARVPIIKYRQELTNLDCDVSLYNTSCLQMSEILYLLGCVDQKVKDIVVVVRAWAKEIGLTNSSPGRWISNFSLTLLVLFFLQQPSIEILPPLKKLKNKNHIMTSKQFSEYASSLLQQRKPSTMTTEQILLKFFQFYSTYDFTAFGLNLLSGKTVVKPDYSAMFIVNPIQPELNVSKNVSAEETDRLRAEMRNAAWQLEASTQSNPLNGEHWGLAQLLVGNIHSQVTPQAFSRGRSRLVDVKSLFDG